MATSMSRMGGSRLIRHPGAPNDGYIGRFRRDHPNVHGTCVLQRIDWLVLMPESGEMTLQRESRLE